MKINEDNVKLYFNELVKKQIIKKNEIFFSQNEIFNFNKDEILQILDSKSSLSFNNDDNNLYYEYNGELIKCPDVDSGIENATIFLCDRIPDRKSVV